jgi:hypothetical protein
MEATKRIRRVPYHCTGRSKNSARSKVEGSAIHRFFHTRSPEREA